MSGPGITGRLLPARCLHHAVRRLVREDRGSVAVEAVIATTVLVVFVLAAVAFGRLVSARQQVSDAAHQAARAASLSRDPVTARRAAETTARQALAGSGTTCGELTVEVQLAFGPGGTARVRLSCTVDLADLQMLGIPGRKTLSATATSPIDVYRSTARASGSSEVPWGANQRAGGEW